MVKSFIIILCSIVASSCYNNFDDPTPDIRSGVSNYSIEALHNNLGDKEYSDITTDLVVQGIITANDKSNNIYNSFTLQYNGYAMEVLIDLTNSYVKFPEGYRVFINLNGLRVDRSYGVVQIGLPAANMGDIEEIAGLMVLDNYICVTSDYDPVDTEVVTLDQLKNNLDLNSYYGKLIELRNMTHIPDTYLNPNNLWSGSNTFEQYDAQLEESEYYTIDVYTSSFSNYSQTSILSGYFRLTGILQSSNQDAGDSKSLSLKMRSADDCQQTISIE